MLLKDFHFSRALIPYNPRNESSLKKVGYNEYGYLACPNDSSVSMKHLGVTKEKGEQTTSNGDAPKCAAGKDSGSVNANIPAVQPPEAELPTPMKIWIYAYFPVSSVILKNGTVSTKSESLWNVL